MRVFIKIGRQEEILGWDGDRLTVGINAPPIEGAANQRLISVISGWIGISKNKVTIVKGHTTRYKTLNIAIEEEVLDQSIGKVPKWPTQQQLL